MRPNVLQSRLSVGPGTPGRGGAFVLVVGHSPQLESADGAAAMLRQLGAEVRSQDLWDDFAAVADRFVAAARAMQRDGWWWSNPALTNKSIKRTILKEMIARRLFSAGP